ncbi:MAG TPA: spore germination protein, partial [Desulfobacteria bacterium]|nr:spore germination protein [Desulfobacteria bacterium]
MWTLLRKKRKNNSPIPPAAVSYDNPASAQPLKSRLNDNKRELQNFFAQCSDIVFREFTGKGYRLLLVYLDTMVDKKLINESILHAVKSERLSAEAGGEQLLKQLADKVVENCEVKQLGSFKQALDAILSGDTVVFTESVSTAFAVSSQGYDFRPVEEPLTESVIRGPREGFTENLNTNISLVRRRLKTPDLKFEAYSLGERTNTRVVIAYLKEVANPEILNEAKNRLQRIKIDSILESAYIEELIEDTPFTVFPQLEATERPDKVAAGLLEGRIAIIVDGTPFSLLLPTTMFQLLQSSEDYYQRFPSAILIRLIRFGFLNLALLAPAIYVAITTFHPEMLPTPLLISIMAAREGVPFPTAIEVAVIEFTFEALREAGVRLPKPVG